MGDRHVGVIRWQRPLDPWMCWATRMLAEGIKEVPGKEHHPIILSWWDHVTYDGTTDEEPHCAAFVCAGLHESGLPSTMDARARSFVGYGVELHGFRFGAIVVFWRGSPDGWKGHVGFAVREEGDYIWVLGANQGPDGEVCIKAYPKIQLLGYYWPEDALFLLRYKATLMVAK